MSRSPGPPPVRPQVPPERALTTAQTNYQVIVETLRANNGAEAKQIRAMLGSDDERDRFLAVCFALLANNNDLLSSATPMSIVQAIRDAARLGLEPLTEEAGIAVYDGVATLLPMWRGYLKRIRNSGLVRDIDTQLVYENDGWDYGYNQNGGWFEHRPVKADRGNYWGAYAYAVMPTRFVELEVMTWDDIEHIRTTFGNTRSRAGKPMPWESSWGEQARKTVLRRLVKRLPQQAVADLTRIEERADEAAAATSQQMAQLQESVSEVRQLALAAVGAAPAEPPAEAPEVAPGSADSRSAEETVDPNIAAAQALAAEEERKLREFRDRR